MEKPIVPDNQPSKSWMYAISTEFTDKKYVPPEAIRGAWYVGERGEIEGDFVENEHFISGLKSTTDWPLYLEPLAKSHPNGWIYDIDKDFRDKESVPKSHIKGSWKVDENGIILPVFYPNENYHAQDIK